MNQGGNTYEFPNGVLPKGALSALDNQAHISFQHCRTSQLIEQYLAERQVMRCLADPIPPRRIGLAWHRDRHRSPAVHAFIETAQRCGQALQTELAMTLLTA